MVWLNILGALGWLKKALGALLGLARSYPLQAALIASLCLSAWLWRGWSNEEAGRVADNLASAAEIKARDDASAKAREEQIALNNENQALNQRIVDNAQARHVEVTRATDRAIADYARAHGVRAYCEGRTGRTSAAPVPTDPGTPVAPDGDELVAVPRKDFDALARDAVRGREAQAFLIDLVNGGLAVVVPEPEFGNPPYP